MKFNIGIVSICLLMVIVYSSCSSQKIVYLDMGTRGGEINLYTPIKGNIVRFQPDDVLSIVVNVVGESSVASDYNLPLQPAANPDNSWESVNTGVGMQTYMVDKNGQVDFPVLGLIKVSGYTREELEKYLKSALRSYLKVDPVVTVRLTNFRISIIGEVNRPGSYNVTKEHLNILEALSLAGDMTIYGKRDDVRLIREMPNGELKIVSLDINKLQAASSPYFYLHQNDQLYVVPNSTKAKSADIGSQTSLLLSLGSIVLTITSIIISVTGR
jgi:polysaccharide export outer membrane protein